MKQTVLVIAILAGILAANVGIGADTTPLHLRIVDRKGKVHDITNAVNQTRLESRGNVYYRDADGLVLKVGASTVTVPWNKITKMVAVDPSEEVKWPCKLTITLADSTTTEAETDVWNNKIKGDIALGPIEVYLQDVKELTVVSRTAEQKSAPHKK